MRKTKIICTIGPASQDEKIIAQLINSGMNVARLNFSHGTHEEHTLKVNTLKRVRSQKNAPVAIMLDTKGPEYRIKTFKDGKVNLKDGDLFTFTTKNIVGDNTKVAVSYKNMAKEINVGDVILVSNGLLSFKVQKIEGQDVVCKVISGGELFDKKSMNFPKKVFDHAYLSAQDKKDIKLGIDLGVDYIACSFVSKAQDVKDVRKFLDKNGGEDIEIIAKIENQTGIDNIDSILAECSGILIGRGDLGVEVAQENLPGLQKYLIKKSNDAGKIVITATEMLESMIKNPRPTRAETSDVANAIYDGSTAIMLSGETAMGKYPLKALETMSNIAEITEQSINYAKRFNENTLLKGNLDAVSRACVSLGIDTNAKAIVACSKTGRTIKHVARFHSPVDVLGMTTNSKMFYKLALHFGVTPFLAKEHKSLNDLFDHARDYAKNCFNLKKGDNIVITGGTASMTNTNLLKIEEI
ncbi:MAG: pyruvate kinase [Clostridiales bacterium]|nr:pyruvate kinase [Clostridiales bacterium]